MRANLLAAEKSVPGRFEIYNVGTAKEHSVVELVSAMQRGWKEQGGASLSQVVHGPALPGEQRRSVIAYDKIQSALGWRPEVDFDSGVVQTLLSFR